MKYLLTLLLSITCISMYADSTDLLFYRIRLDSDIDNAASRLVRLGLEKAGESGADYIILDLNTYGGAVDAADSIRSAILNCPVPVVAFINLQAASAGALISIACDSIYMKTGSSIGAATVVNQTGAVMPDKYQSFMRGMMRSTAQANGRDPEIAESMVDTAHVLSMTPSEAVDAGYCEGICGSVQEVAERIADGREFRIADLDSEMSWFDKLIQFLLNPILQSIFLMMIIGGIYIEFRTPGIGLPLAIAIAGAFLYFSPLLMENLAEYWEVLLFFIGLILIALELFVIPGFGIAGISGIACVVISLIFAMVDNDLLFNGNGGFDYRMLAVPAGIVIISAAAALTGSILLVRSLYRTRTFDRIALRQSLAAEEGFTGVTTSMEVEPDEKVRAFTDLHPSGKIITSKGKIYEAVMESGYASRNDELTVLRTGQGRVYCEKSTSL